LQYSRYAEVKDMLQQIVIIDVLVVLLFLAVLIYVRPVKIVRATGQGEAPANKPGQRLSFATWLKELSSIKIQREDWVAIRPRLGTLAELVLIVAWALWLGRKLWITDSSRWLNTDWALNVQSYFAWGLVKKCGLCVLWNGYFNGGAPLFVDLLAAMAHPLVVLFVVLAGAINGSKLIAVAALVMAGIAQWWLAKEMHLGFFPRMWSAALAVVGGHLVGRILGGLSELVFSMASIMLVIPAAIRLVRTGERRMAIVVGLLLGLVFLSGQGYMQVGLVLGIFPAFLILLIDEPARMRPVWKEFLLAGIIAILVSAILWLPVAHISSNIVKPMTTADYPGIQPFGYQPLNLVIHDDAYFNTDVLQKVPWPAHILDYIGWIPVLLAFFAIRLIPRSGLRLLLFYCAAIILIYATSSAVTLKFIYHYFPAPFSNLAAIVRSPDLIAGLAVPFILALAAWGLDLVMKLNWPKLTWSLASGGTLGLSIVWLILIPLFTSVKAVYDYVKPGLETVQDPVDASYYSVLPKIKPASTQWVEPPMGDWGFDVVAVENGIKLTNVEHLWDWKNRDHPSAYLKVSSDPLDPSNPNYANIADNWNTLVYPENSYAFVDTGVAKVPCQATALGGNIDIRCDTPVAGTLTVYENSWSGWGVKRDGKPVALAAGRWLGAQAPAGKHTYQFRYRPWDVPLGAALSLIGLGLSAWLWFRKPRKPSISS
jgi:hypothetical protein